MVAKRTAGHITPPHQQKPLASRSETPPALDSGNGSATAPEHTSRTPEASTQKPPPAATPMKKTRAQVRTRTAVGRQQVIYPTSQIPALLPFCARVPESLARGTQNTLFQLHQYIDNMPKEAREAEKLRFKPLFYHFESILDNYVNQERHLRQWKFENPSADTKGVQEPLEVVQARLDIAHAVAYTTALRGLSVAEKQQYQHDNAAHQKVRRDFVRQRLMTINAFLTSMGKERERPVTPTSGKPWLLTTKQSRPPNSWEKDLIERLKTQGAYVPPPFPAITTKNRSTPTAPPPPAEKADESSSLSDTIAITADEYAEAKASLAKDRAFMEGMSEFTRAENTKLYQPGIDADMALIRALRGQERAGKQAKVKGRPERTKEKLGRAKRKRPQRSDTSDETRRALEESIKVAQVREDQDLALAMAVSVELAAEGAARAKKKRKLGRSEKKVAKKS